MEHNHSSSEIKIHHATKVGVWSYWPIVAIYIVAALISLYTIQFHIYPDYMSHLMGWVLIFFGIIKLSDVVGFAEGFAKYDPLAKRSIVYAQVYPFLEITLGVLFILQLLILPATLITLFIYSASLFGALQSMMKKETLHCVCLGTYFKLPLSTVTITEAVFMIGMCIWMLVMLNSMTMMVM
ncbi:MAG TPA: hypothetical protein PKA42_02450 [Candidatus Paceibacterota bacterium]|jgi:hypothetical protein|nr:hypothetical protein [Candidatus Paceibacterota bacterium]HMO83004.1 hypothetical protein [Candidatus Paceibacterota bacterium]